MNRINVIDCTDSYSTLLHVAVENNQIVAVDLLLKYNININEYEVDLKTSLHVATLRGTPSLTKFLVDHGANIDTIWDDTLQHGGVMPLDLAAQNGRKEIVEILLTKPINLNVTYNALGNPLHQAAINDDLEIAKLLIEHEANSNIENFGELTALHITAVDDKPLSR